MNLVEYQADAEHTMRAVPEMVRLLQDDDRQNVALKSAAFVNQLSQKDASRVAMSQSSQLVSTIVSQLNTCQPNEVDFLHHLINALHNMCNEVSGVQLTFKSGGIAALVRLLSLPIDNVLFYAITILHTLLVYEESAKGQIRKCGGIQKMCALLAHTNQKFIAKVVDCLKMLAFNSNESKLIISASRASADLVRIMRVSNYEKLLWTCVRLMKVLSVCSSNKPALLDAGALQVLSAHVAQPINERILVNSLLTLRNISDCATREDNLEALVRKLVDYLAAPNGDFNIGVCAAGILSNLTCNNDFNKMKFVECGGIEAMVRLMIQSNSMNASNGQLREEVFEPCVCTLRHVTNRNVLAGKAQELVRAAYGLPVVVQLLQTPGNASWPLVKATIGLVRNLALNDNNIAALRELGVIPKLVHLLMQALGIMQQRGDECIVDDVPMGEIVEASVGGLHQLARDELNRGIIRELKCVPVLVQLLYLSWESIQRVACGCLCELANDREGTEAMESLNATERLTDLLRSKDEAIATYAAAVLFRLSEDKSANYGQSINYKINPANGMVDYTAYNSIDPYEMDLKGHDGIVMQPSVVQANQYVVHGHQMATTGPEGAWFDSDV